MSGFATLCSDVLKQKHHLRFEFSPVGTVVEGSLEECLEGIKEVVAASLQNNERVILNLKADIIPGVEDRTHNRKVRIKKILEQKDEELEQN
jgi:uncharacterized protein YqgV (UPF0045/DUF77 family)